MLSQMYSELAPLAIADALAVRALSSPTPVRRSGACRLSARESLKRRSIELPAVSWCTDQGCRAQAQRPRCLAAPFSLRGACSCSQEAAGGCAAHARRQRADVRGLCTLGNDGRRWPPPRAATAACVPCARLGLSARCARSAAGRSPASSPSSTRNPASPGRHGHECSGYLYIARAHRTTRSTVPVTAAAPA
jgi:hypothetical protein